MFILKCSQSCKSDIVLSVNVVLRRHKLLMKLHVCYLHAAHNGQIRHCTVCAEDLVEILRSTWCFVYKGL